MKIFGKAVYMNPIMKKEMRIGARSFRFPAAMMLYSLFMTIVVFGMMVVAGILNGSSPTALIDYTVFTAAFLIFAFLQAGIICLIMPAMTAGSISTEREKQTLDLMLSTPITPFSIMLGKLGSAMMEVLMFTFCSLPAMAVCFLYGGIQWPNLIAFVVGIMLLAFFVGAAGIWSSALFQKTILSILFTMLTELVFFALGPGLMLGVYIYQYSHSYALLGYGAVANLGILPVLLLFNPAFTFAQSFLYFCNGTNLASYVITDGLDGTIKSAKILEGLVPIWIPLSVAILVLMGLGFLLAAAGRVDGNRRKSLKIGKDKKH